ncbi:hypothetical protein L6452_33784 [Arctium lappa]|uniref:Uncharacterized protein n=1 Tax=Arctium lappa TaxID=4217 RepID=A0ACB8YGE4_ARCLA|nr:hypothetical protein L6452_33784 [Arctium lappa]
MIHQNTEPEAKGKAKGGVGFHFWWGKRSTVILLNFLFMDLYLYFIFGDLRNLFTWDSFWGFVCLGLQFHYFTCKYYVHCWTFGPRKVK